MGDTLIRRIQRDRGDAGGSRPPAAYYKLCTGSLKDPLLCNQTERCHSADDFDQDAEREGLPESAVRAKQPDFLYKSRQAAGLPE